MNKQRVMDPVGDDDESAKPVNYFIAVAAALGLLFGGGFALFVLWWVVDTFLDWADRSVWAYAVVVFSWCFVLPTLLFYGVPLEPMARAMLVALVTVNRSPDQVTPRLLERRTWMV